MKKILLLPVICYLLTGIALASPVAQQMQQALFGGVGVTTREPGSPLPRQCEIVEQLLWMQVMQAGGGQMIMNVDMALQLARAYRELSRRGCPENRPAFAIGFAAAIDTAYALVDIEAPVHHYATMPGGPPGGTLAEVQAHNDAIAERARERQILVNQIREVERQAPIHGW